MALNEDQRQAASLKIGISNYVATAALAIIAGAGALFTFVQQNFTPSLLFYGTIFASVAAAGVSIVLGGRGAESTLEAIAKSTWSITTKTNTFNLQAIFALAGVVAVLVAAWPGIATSTPRVQRDPCVSPIAAELSKNHPSIGQLRADLAGCQGSKSTSANGQDQ